MAILSPEAQQEREERRLDYARNFSARALADLLIDAEEEIARLQNGTRKLRQDQAMTDSFQEVLGRSKLAPTMRALWIEPGGANEIRHVEVDAVDPDLRPGDRVAFGHLGVDGTYISPRSLHVALVVAIDEHMLVLSGILFDDASALIRVIHHREPVPDAPPPAIRGIQWLDGPRGPNGMPFSPDPLDEEALRKKRLARGED